MIAEQEKWIESIDGTGLYARAAIPGHPKGIVVIVHGICEHQGRYDYVADRLQAAGYGVWRYDLRGHGRSEGTRVFYKSFQEMIGDLDCVVTRAAGENCGASLFLLGHSMGGMIASLYATKYPDRISGVVLTGARTRFNHSEWAEILPLDEAEETCHETSFGIGLCTDPEVVKAYRADPLVEKHYTAGIRNSCWNGVLWQKAHAGDFTVPVLIMHGEADSIVSPEESGDFFREIGSRDKTLRICAGLYHEILNEPCRDTVIGEITSWLDRQLFSKIPNPETSAHPAATKAGRY